MQLGGSTITSLWLRLGIHAKFSISLATICVSAFRVTGTSAGLSDLEIFAEIVAWSPKQTHLRYHMRCPNPSIEGPLKHRSRPLEPTSIVRVHVTIDAVQDMRYPPFEILLFSELAKENKIMSVDYQCQRTPLLQCSQ